MQNNNSFDVVYDVAADKFIFPENMVGEDKLLFDLHKDKIIADLDRLKLETKPVATFIQVEVNESAFKERTLIIGFVSSAPSKTINVVITDISSQAALSKEMRYLVDFDSLTGLYNKEAFIRRVDIALAIENDKKNEGKFAMVYMDVSKFKAINEIFGQLTADSVLKHIASSINNLASSTGFGCRIGSDRFCAFVESSGEALESSLKILIEQISSFMSTYRIICNVGVYITCQDELTAQEMIGRAILAQNLIKGNIKEQINYYKDDMRKKMLTEQEIASLMNNALRKGEFVVYYQPQYEHSTKRLVGAEALVRWIHPEKGMLSPASFIPIFESNGFITTLDMYVFENTCSFIAQRLKENKKIIPVSTNFSRCDLFEPKFVEKLENIRNKYKVDAKYLRIEITESAFVGESEYINNLIKQLHSFGYIVEMDDFGSGYSSLNTLKDIDFDVIKLDMNFMSEEEHNTRGGTILSSVVKMANWLNLPVIAEGVETMKQADYLKSIGSDYIQGYLYSKPLPESEFVKLLEDGVVGNNLDYLRTAGEALNLWDPNSLDSLIFNSFIGPSAILEYSNGKVEYSRINSKYLSELGMRESEKDLLVKQNLLDSLNADDRKKYIQTIDNVIYSGQDHVIECWRKINSRSCGNLTLCIRTELKFLAKGHGNYLIFASVRNITGERFCQLDKVGEDAAATYHWEYNVEKKEMYPCMRCKNDLGLPDCIYNYPEPLIDSGFFPAEIADFYRDWHKQIGEGRVSHLEAVLPLTENRIPHTVKYDVIFDSLGKPVKAYGSATAYVEK